LRGADPSVSPRRPPGRAVASRRCVCASLLSLSSALACSPGRSSPSAASDAISPPVPRGRRAEPASWVAPKPSNIAVDGRHHCRGNPSFRAGSTPGSSASPLLLELARPGHGVASAAQRCGSDPAVDASSFPHRRIPIYTASSNGNVQRAPGLLSARAAYLGEANSLMRLGALPLPHPSMSRRPTAHRHERARRAPCRSCAALLFVLLLCCSSWRNAG